MSQPISFCINTSKNELPYIARLMESLANGIDVDKHEVFVFVDSDNQCTARWLRTLKSEFPNLTGRVNIGNPVGYAGNINYMFQHAKHDIVSYLQSDMVVGLKYDEKLLAHVAKDRILCATRCEPDLHAKQDNQVTFVRNFGYTPAEFNDGQYQNFLRFAEANKDPDKLTNYFFAPFTLYKRLWNDIGGHDVSFKKSREDSDIALRLALSGYELKQTWDAIVYHFTCTSSRGIEWWKPENQHTEFNRQQGDMQELSRFQQKWGDFFHASSPDEPRVQQLKFQLLSRNMGRDIGSIVTVKNPPIDETKLTIL
jgi:GT2 family glycosyltransferase